MAVRFFTLLVALSADFESLSFVLEKPLDSLSPASPKEEQAERPVTLRAMRESFQNRISILRNKTGHTLMRAIGAGQVFFLQMHFAVGAKHL